MKKQIGIISIVLLVSITMLVGTAIATPTISMSGPQWKVLTIETLPNGGQKLFDSHPSTMSGGSGVQFNFPEAGTNSYVAYLVTNYNGGLTGSITATIYVTVTGGAQFGFNPNGGSTPPTVRLFFESTHVPGTSKQYGYDEYNYWWSNPTSYSLTSIESSGSTFVLTVTLDPSLWSDLYGHFGNTNSTTETAFDYAVAHVALIGLTFGGGYFFANGDYVTSGSATFYLTSYTISAS